jgi:hypothetical protein
VGALITVAMLSAAFVIDRSAERGDPDRAAAVARLFGGDPWLENYVAAAYQSAFARTGGSDGQLLLKTVDHARRAAQLYPTADNLVGLADVAVDVDDLDTAQAALEQAVSLERWNPQAHERLFLIARFRGLDELAERERAVLCELGEYWCQRTKIPPDPAAEP